MRRIGHLELRKVLDGSEVVQRLMWLVVIVGVSRRTHDIAELTDVGCGEIFPWCDVSIRVCCEAWSHFPHRLLPVAHERREEIFDDVPRASFDLDRHGHAGA